MKLISEIIDAIRIVTGPGQVALHEPEFKGNELDYIKDCIDSTFVSSVGKYVDRFEAELAYFTKAKNAIAVVNGTAALHIALKLAGVSQEDEVLVPALTFVATANAVAHCNAVPHFVEIEEGTLGIDAQKLREYLSYTTEQHNNKCINKFTGRVIRALVPMHTFGHPSNLEGLLAVAKDFGLVLVEDAAESLGSTYCGQHTGTFGLMGILSFNGNKIITTGGGGAILTNNTELAFRAKHLTTTAKKPHRWAFDHDEIGYNYRMPNLNAALGCAQLEKLPHMLEAKRGLFKRYQQSFSDVKGVRLYMEPAYSNSNYWLQALILDDENSVYRELLLQRLNDDGLMARPAWTLMSNLPPFKNCPQMSLSHTQSLAGRIVNIPSSSFLVKTRNK